MPPGPNAAGAIDSRTGRIAAKIVAIAVRMLGTGARMCVTPVTTAASAIESRIASTAAKTGGTDGGRTDESGNRVIG